MTQLDPSIILQAGNYRPIDVGQMMQQREQIKLSQLARARGERADALEQQKTVRMRDVGTKIAAGDYDGAHQTAATEGDLDLYQTITGLQGDHRAQVKAKIDAVAPIAFQVGQLPYEERRTAIASAMPTLENAGWKPEEIEQFDPTDANIAQAVASAQSLDQVYKRYETEQRLAETTRHNKANEGIALNRIGASRDASMRADARYKRGQDISSSDRRRGQDMTDRRIRETNSGGGKAPKVWNVTTPEQARQLPKGTHFRTPDGQVKIR